MKKDDVTENIIKNDLEAPLKEEENTTPTAEDEAAKLKDQLYRTAAELENVRKRFDREKDDLRKYAVTQFARDLLGVSDNLKRALNVPEDQQDTTVKPFLEGVKMVDKELTDVLNKFGVNLINAMGEAFDANLHQAMFEVEVDDPAQIGKIVQVVQDGYRIHDRLLRPSFVGVGKQKVG